MRARPLLIFCPGGIPDEAQCLLLDDGVSVGAVYEVTPAATEGRTAERLEQIRDTVEDALQDSFDEYDTHPPGGAVLLSG